MHGGNIYEIPIEYDFSVNINPMGIEPSLADHLAGSIQKLTHYPDLTQRAFRQKVSQLAGVDEDMILGGNGASELIMAVVRAIAPKRVLLLSPCFNGYYHALHCMAGIEISIYALQEAEDYRLDERILEYIDDSLDMFILATPNNPNGALVSPELLMKILNKCQDSGTVLMLDECFLQLTDASLSLKSMTYRYSSLIVVDAFTKSFAIPGLRVGYMVSSRANVERTAAMLPEWNMSVLAEDAGAYCASLAMNTDYLVRSRILIARERAYLAEGLRKLHIRVYDSEANYLLLRSDMELYNPLAARGILIRDCRDYDSLSEGYYRIAVKKHSDNCYLLDCIGRIAEDRQN